MYADVQLVDFTYHQYQQPPQLVTLADHESRDVQVELLH